MNKKKHLKFKIKLLIVVIFLILTIILIKKFNKPKEYISHTPVHQEIDTKKDGILNLSGFGTFFDHYTGELKSSEIATGLKEITISKIPRIHKIIKGYNKEELETFFDNNGKSLKNMVGIDNKEDFVQFAQGLQKVKVDFNKWDRLDIITDTFVDVSTKEGYAYAEYEVKYQNDEKIKFSVYISRTATADVLYMVNVI